MDLDHEACYRAICTRDARFDGRLFIGVKSTGIYCRPVCPARTPKREYLSFYPTAAAAQAAGFRPCLRCRPETAPDLAAWRGTSNTVSRALALIERGALDDADVDTLAAQLGVGERQLRRLFDRHLGASPIAVAQTRRVLLAKQLVHETRLPMAEVALAAGFGSIRRFNETFQQLFRRPPSTLRRGGAADVSSGPKGEVAILLRYRPPYDWAGMLAALRARAVAGIERASDDTYTRAIGLGGVQGSVSVRAGDGNTLRATILFAKLSAFPTIVAGLRRVFDLAADPEVIGAHLSEDPALAPLVAARPGLRVPGAWDASDAPDDPDRFSAADLEVVRSVLGAGARPERWRPWRAYAVQYLRTAHGPAPVAVRTSKPPAGLRQPVDAAGGAREHRALLVGRRPGRQPLERVP